MAFIAVLLRWPDMNQARLYVLGFGSVGEMEASGPNQACEKLLKLLPEWIQFVVNPNDLLDAYRQCPNAPWKAHLNVAGFLHSKLKRWYI